MKRSVIRKTVLAANHHHGRVPSPKFEEPTCRVLRSKLTIRSTCCLMYGKGLLFEPGLGSVWRYVFIEWKTMSDQEHPAHPLNMEIYRSIPSKSRRSLVRSCCGRFENSERLVGHFIASVSNGWNRVVAFKRCFPIRLGHFRFTFGRLV